MRSRPLLWSTLALTTAVLAVLAGCTSGAEPAAEAGPVVYAGKTAPEDIQLAPAARLSSSVASGRVQAAHHARVRVSQGELASVRLSRRGPQGYGVEGRLSDHAWKQTGQLVPSSHYRLTANATNPDGERTRRTWRFTTAEPGRTDLPAVSPVAGAEVGVGHPVIVYFDYTVADPAAVEDLMTVQTSQPVTGSWGWIDDRTAAWRPKTFWPGETDVSVQLDLAHTQLQPGVWVMEDRTVDFRVGRRQVLRISDATHTMTVERDGAAIRSVPVSMGKPGFTTRSGVKVIMTQEVSRRMDSSTVGIGGSEAYDLEVPYALRVTATGEFIHGAPWSEWAQGSQNVSHGCTNVSLDNAIWLYHNTLIGDPVVTSGTGRGTEEWNGLGGIWNYRWSEWRDRAAA